MGLERIFVGSAKKAAEAAQKKSGAKTPDAHVKDAATTFPVPTTGKELGRSRGKTLVRVAEGALATGAMLTLAGCWIDGKFVPDQQPGQSTESATPTVATKPTQTSEASANQVEMKKIEASAQLYQEAWANRNSTNLDDPHTNALNALTFTQWGMQNGNVTDNGQQASGLPVVVLGSLQTDIIDTTNGNTKIPALAQEVVFVNPKTNQLNFMWAIILAFPSNEKKIQIDSQTVFQKNPSDGGNGVINSMTIAEIQAKFSEGSKEYVVFRHNGEKELKKPKVNYGDNDALFGYLTDYTDVRPMPISTEPVPLPQAPDNTNTGVFTTELAEWN